MGLMKVIFLDIDGVCNCSSTTDRLGRYTGIDQDKVDLLKDIVDKTDAYIVVSSTWRIHKEFMEYLEKRLGEDLWKRYLGDTINILYGTRFEEIDDWLSKNKVDNFIVLDDDHIDSLINFDKHFVQTWFADGLTREIADKCILKLNEVIQDECLKFYQGKHCGTPVKSN
jgi:hypothetical protein